MIGTEKQIAFASKCMQAAEAHFGRIVRRGMSEGAVDADGSQRAALQIVRLINAGQTDAAQAVLESSQHVAAWWELTLQGQAVDAGRVIDQLKRYC